MAPVEMPKVDAAVVVDPYSSGRFLLYELKNRNMPIICVRSSLKVGAYYLKVYETHKEYFAETVDFESFDNVDQLVDFLDTLPFNMIAVFGGSEPGVELADNLAEKLGLATANGTELLTARKDKAEMQERLRQCGVPAADQFRSDDLQELLNWARERGEWPVVAKPTCSAGSDGVFFCRTEKDLADAHGEIIGKLNPTGVVNTSVALQEFLAGDEYIIDTVSLEGKHLAVACWVYDKVRGLPWNSTAIMAKQSKLLPATGEKQDQLISYVFRVLDAMGIQYGACHTEVMFTKRGPILVEVNNRMIGVQGPQLIELATGTSIATYYADALVGGGELFNKVYVPSPGRYLYPVLKHCVQLLLISPTEGYLRKPLQDVINAMQLTSVVEICPAVAQGGYLNKTCDLATAAGGVVLVHESAELIESDIGRIREAEANGDLYIVSQEPLMESPKLAPKPRSMSSPRMQSMEKAEETWATLEELPEAAMVAMTGLEEDLMKSEI